MPPRLLCAVCTKNYFPLEEIMIYIHALATLVVLFIVAHAIWHGALK